VRPPRRDAQRRYPKQFEEASKVRIRFEGDGYVVNEFTKNFEAAQVKFASIIRGGGYAELYSIDKDAVEVPRPFLYHLRRSSSLRGFKEARERGRPGRVCRIVEDVE